MPDFLSPLTDLCQTQIEASRRIVDAFIHGTGKIDRVVLDATHRALDEQFQHAQAVGRTRDVEVLTNLQSTYWSSRPVQMHQFQQEYLRILTEVQNEIGRATQVFVEQFGTSALRTMPPGLQGGSAISRAAAPNPFEHMFSAWSNVMQTLPRLVEPIMAAVPPRGSDTRPENENGNTSRNGNGHDHDHGNGNTELQHPPNGHRAPDDVTSRRPTTEESAGSPMPVRAHDEDDDDAEPSNGSGGTHRKSVGSRRK